MPRRLRALLDRLRSAVASDDRLDGDRFEGSGAVVLDESHNGQYEAERELRAIQERAREIEEADEPG